MSALPPNAANPPVFSLRSFLLLLLIGLVPFGAVGGYMYWQAQRVEPVDYIRNLTGCLKRSQQEGGPVAFTDADGDLVADAPTDPAQQKDPAELVFAPLASEPATPEEPWKGFLEHL